MNTHKGQPYQVSLTGIFFLMLRVPPGLRRNLSATRFAFMTAAALAVPDLDPLVAEGEAQLCGKGQVGIAPVGEESPGAWAVAMMMVCHIRSLSDRLRSAILSDRLRSAINCTRSIGRPLKIMCRKREFRPFITRFSASSRGPPRTITGYTLRLSRPLFQRPLLKAGKPHGYGLFHLSFFKYYVKQNDCLFYHKYVHSPS